MKTLALVTIVVVLFAAGALWLSRQKGFSARDEPSAVEAFVARRLRLLSIPAAGRDAANPVAPTVEVLRDARAHFADHCALCHANDGSGDTDIGRNLYPPPPDMREDRTQSLTDGELFWIIRNGIRFTGMPAFGGGDPDEDSESWGLVHFIRRIPDLTPEEIAGMEKLNPKSLHELEEEMEIRRFLGGENEPSRSEPHHHAAPGGHSH